MRLMPFVMLGYPTLADSLKVLDFLSGRDVITETALPSPEVKGKLANYHERAIEAGVTEEKVFEVFDDCRPNFLMLRSKQTDAQLRKISEAFDYACAPVNATELGKYNSGRTRFVAKVSPTHIDRDAILSSRGFVYLQCARSRGEKMFGEKELYEAVRTIRATRSSLPIIAGYGVKSADDAAKLAFLGADVVAVGSESVKAQEAGFEAFEAFWRRFESSLPVE
ncbi:tryptophan synthase subunit alpha [Candidatus Micrarchaeota archaeon]|nr:tryptophan synthase subunit alpha [Candidatus Micrarchaeota archaeon]